MKNEEDRDALEDNVDILILADDKLEELGVHSVSELWALAVAIVREYTCWYNSTMPVSAHRTARDLAGYMPVDTKSPHLSAITLSEQFNT